jgi:hypothetical protein
VDPAWFAEELLVMAASARVRVYGIRPDVTVLLDQHDLGSLAFAVHASVRVERHPEVPDDSWLVIVFLGAQHAEVAERPLHVIVIGPLRPTRNRDVPLKPEVPGAVW